MDLIPAESAPKMDLVHTQQYRILVTTSVNTFSKIILIIELIE